MMNNIHRLLWSAVLGIWLSMMPLHAQTAGYAELPNPRKANAKLWQKQNKVLYASFASKWERYAKEQPPKLAKEINFWGETVWRGERIATQLLLWSGTGSGELSITLTNLETSGGQKLSAANGKVGMVRYVMSSGKGKSSISCQPIRIASQDSVLVPDVIQYGVSTVSVPARTVVPLWISFQIPDNTPTGKYKGFITIAGKNLKTPIQYSINFYVRDQVMPTADARAFYLDLWQNPYAVAKQANVEPWSKAHLDKLQPLMQQLAIVGQKSITVPLSDMMLTEASTTPMESMVILSKSLDGAWEIDPSRMDKWVEYATSQGIPLSLNCHLSTQPKQTIRYFDKPGYEVKQQELTMGTKAYEEFVQSYLRQLAAHLESKNWLDKSVIYLQRMPLDQARKMMALIRSADPRLKIAYKDKFYPELNELVSHYATPITLPLDAAQLTGRNAKKLNTTLCTTCRDSAVHITLASPLPEGVAIGWLAAAKGYTGYTGYANDWNAQPLRDGRMPYGGPAFSYLLYPGQQYSSIRFELLYESIQDFEKISMLRTTAMQNKDMVMLDKINKMLKPFAPLPTTSKGLEQAINDARIALNSL